MNKLKLFIASIMAVAFAFTPAVVLAADGNIQEGLCSGANLSANTDANCPANNQQAANSIQKIVTTVINIFSWIVGVVSVIMIIIGGFRYITSGGDANGVTAAKNTILYAIVGLIIVALAQIIVKFVIGSVTNATG